MTIKCAKTVFFLFGNINAIRTAPLTDAELLNEIAAIDQALVIVNSRRHALELYRVAKATELADVVHLTTRQTAADRRRILAAIRNDLKAGRPCRVIATSFGRHGHVSTDGV